MSNDTESETTITQDEFEEWCGAHQVKSCGRRRTMCEDYCRPLATADVAHQRRMADAGVKDSNLVLSR